MLERHDVNCVLDDACKPETDTETKPETAELNETDTISDRDYQAGFWSPPN